MIQARQEYSTILFKLMQRSTYPLINKTSLLIILYLLQSHLLIWDWASTLEGQYSNFPRKEKVIKILKIFGTADDFMYEVLGMKYIMKFVFQSQRAVQVGLMKLMSFHGTTNMESSLNILLLELSTENPVDFLKSIQISLGYIFIQVIWEK